MNERAFEPPAIAGGIPDLTDLTGRVCEPDEPVAVFGRRAQAAGVAGLGIRELTLRGAAALTSLEVDTGLAQRTVETPVMLQRELVTGITERMFVPLDQAAAAWCWTAHNGARFALRFRFDADAGQLEMGTRWAAVADAACWFDRGVKLTRVDSGVQADIELRSGESVTMIAAERATRGTGSALLAMSNLPALVRGRLADWRRAESDLVRVACSDSRYADRVNWSAYQLHAAGVALEHLLDSDLENSPLLVTAAAPVRRFLRDVLGLDIDAPTQRVELRPRLPADWDRLDARNLPCGDARITFHYERTHDAHIFQLAPVAGAVPARIAFLPLVRARALGSVTVDGVAATLELRSTPEGIVCPVQLVLDHTRTIRIRVAAA